MWIEPVLLSYVFVVLGLWFVVKRSTDRLRAELHEAGATVKEIMQSQSEEALVGERTLLDWWVANSAYTAIDGEYLGWEYADKQSEWIKIVDGDIRAATRQAMAKEVSDGTS